MKPCSIAWLLLGLLNAVIAGPTLSFGNPKPIGAGNNSAPNATTSITTNVIQMWNYPNGTNPSSTNATFTFDNETDVYLAINTTVIIPELIRPFNISDNAIAGYTFNTSVPVVGYVGFTHSIAANFAPSFAWHWGANGEARTERTIDNVSTNSTIRLEMYSTKIHQNDSMTIFWVIQNRLTNGTIFSDEHNATIENVSAQDIRVDRAFWYLGPPNNTLGTYFPWVVKMKIWSQALMKNLSARPGSSCSYLGAGTINVTALGDDGALSVTMYPWTDTSLSQLLGNETDPGSSNV